MADRDSSRGRREQRILSIDPRIRRVGAAYFEGAVLADWAIRNIRQDPPDVRVRKRLIPALIRMLDHYEPTTLIVPDIGPQGVRRSANVREIVQAIAREAARLGIDVISLNDRQVKDVFETARPGTGRNKRTRNELLLEWFPTLEPQRPKARRTWDSEPHAQPLFDAIARWCAWRGLPKTPASK
jgi:hypothetical protein